ncbi:sulfatase-like hydrolase/transferase [Coraliomargarita sp. SDUM461004]|uniref:Sulfatase-like hydrolase/transferase n=1 Tax=Thalassobacterium sedimentorum TaxID=3041258 RepID=A0ABU1ALF9_9BACT|nr:sulfatase-like hydrolase/transferase [Coraliomargarita sp. SDUM461004]MDQ8195642.1 sulfatase-like hydrolase/transferase [Coraliomargarita sp. SDUM461004]
MKKIPVLISLIASLVSTSVSYSHAETSELVASQPNILFIFADDWGWEDLSCHGHPYVKTPNIDRLAAEGTDFHRFTVASGVCSPSRTAVMTGHFPARYNVDGHFAWVKDNARRGMPDWVDPAAPMLPRMLQSAGYRTAHFGKWHISNNMIPDSPPASEYGYDEYGTFNASGEQMPYDHDARRAIAFMEKAKAEERPFFINLWIHEPHTPFHVIPKYRQMFPELEDDGDSIYAATLAYADERIGEVLDALDALDLADDTLVIFSSDNGPARAREGQELTMSYDSATGVGFGIAAAKGLTGGRKGYKAALYQGGINVPFLARWPGKIPEGAVDDQSMISAVDLLPTFCSIAGADLVEGYEPDGINQVAALLGESTTGREKDLFWKSETRRTKPEASSHWANYVVVSDHWKFLTNGDPSNMELYDIVTDPLESKNLAEAHPETVFKLQQKLTDWLATLPPEPTGDVFSKLRETLK